MDLWQFGFFEYVVMVLEIIVQLPPPPFPPEDSPFAL